jgi:signal transduction histidine kinase/CheY-like chemotaxis protein
LVRVTAFVDPCGYSPCLILRSIQVVGSSKLPAARHAAAHQIDQSTFEAQRVTVNGTIRAVAMMADPRWPNSAGMLLESEGRRWKLIVAGVQPAELDHFYDATVRVDAIAGAEGNSSRQLIAPVLFVQSPSAIAIIDDIDNWRIAPLVAASGLLKFEGPAHAAERVRLRGVVTAALPGVGIFLQEGDTGVFLESLQDVHVRPGDRVEGEGRVAMGNRRPYLRDAKWTLLERGQPGIAAHPIAGEQLSLDRHDSRRISIDAVFEGDNRASAVRPRVVFDLRSLDGVRFVAFYEDPATTPPEFTPGSTLRVTGVLRANTDPVGSNRQVYRVLVAAASDLQLLAAPPWWNASRVTAALGIVSALGLVCLVWVWTLRTRVRLQTRELRAAKEAAEAADSAKAQFVAQISHEIRTPMNGVLGMIDLARRTASDPATIESLAISAQSANDLLDLLNDVLDLSKLDAGKLHLESTSFSLSALLTAAHRLFSIRAADKNLLLALHLSPDLPRWSLGDPARLRQIVHNLLTNAIKFTPAGVVKLRAFPVGDAVTIEVEDTGIGIPLDQMDRIFQPFEQADSTITRRYGGTGLGLPIAAKIVDAMGSTLAVDSRVGHGSRFHFTISLPPGTPVPDDTPSQAVSPLDKSLRILIAEDNTVNLTVVRRMVEHHGHTVIAARNGRVAVELWRTEKPDLILMDIQMPDMDGFTAALAIRAGERDGARVPIIALTAHALEGYSERTAEAGMDAYLTKPIREADLLSTIHQLLATPAS